jgi:hypothetical protein
MTQIPEQWSTDIKRGALGSKGLLKMIRRVKNGKVGVER